MKRRTVLFLLIAAMCVGSVACASAKDPQLQSPDSTQPDTESPTTEKPTEPSASTDPTPAVTPQTTYRINSNTNGVRILGVRNVPSEQWVTCDWTCSGFELNVDCTVDGDITFGASSSAYCYFRAYVDGNAWGGANPYYTVGLGRDQIVLKNVPAGRHTVRLIKVTGHTLATAQVYNVALCGEITEPAPAEKELYIEFAGDSICCGWGLIGAKDGTYKAQDGSLAYPYLVAEAMNADYSITALSGQGLLMGNPGMTNGYLLISPKRNEKNDYLFSRAADVVVINIGTNDYNYRNQYNFTAEQFEEAYLQFLQTVKKKNPNCKIVCIYNTMCDTFQESIKSAVETVGGEKVGVFLLKFDRTTNTESAGHPSIAENAAYAAVLKSVIETVLTTTENSTGGETT